MNDYDPNLIHPDLKHLKVGLKLILELFFNFICLKYSKTKLYFKFHNLHFFFVDCFSYFRY